MTCWWFLDRSAFSGTGSRDSRVYAMWVQRLLCIFISCCLRYCVTARIRNAGYDVSPERSFARPASRARAGSPVRNQNCPGITRALGLLSTPRPKGLCKGARRATLCQALRPGYHTIQWQPRNLASGVYHARVHTPKGPFTQSMVYVNH